MLTGLWTLKPILTYENTYTYIFSFPFDWIKTQDKCLYCWYMADTKEKLYMQCVLLRSLITMYITKSNLSTMITGKLVRLNM